MIMGTVPQTAVEDAFKTICAWLKQLNPGWEGNSQFQNTPERLLRFYLETCWSSEAIQREINLQMKAFDQGYDEMLAAGPVTAWTLCPHHLLPCRFEVVVGYIPNGRVLGLSKIARVSIIVAKRPVMQEQYTQDLAEVFQEELKPKGVGVYVNGIHGCMASRGVLQSFPVETTCLKGNFLNDPSTKSEFMDAVNRKMNG
jgi:GTP cyclohydrolase I